MKILKELWQNEDRPPAFTALDVFRALLHLPVGVFAGWLIIEVTALGIVFSLGFLTYELCEDWRISDRSYKDIFGYLIGLAIAGLLIS